MRRLRQVVHLMMHITNGVVEPHSHSKCDTDIFMICRPHIPLLRSIAAVTSTTSPSSLSPPMNSFASRVSSVPASISCDMLCEPPIGRADGVEASKRGLWGFCRSQRVRFDQASSPGRHEYSEKLQQRTSETIFISIACRNGTLRPNAFLCTVCWSCCCVDAHCSRQP